MSASDSTEMKQLRQFLASTVALQADFLVQRLQRALPKMLAEAPAADRPTSSGNSRASPARRKAATRWSIT